jgi:hypothetical protein
MKVIICQWLCRFGWLGHVILAFFALNYARFEPNGDFYLYRKLADILFLCLFLLSFIPAVGIGDSIQERFSNIAKAFVQSILVMFAVLSLTVMGIVKFRP